MGRCIVVGESDTKREAYIDKVEEGEGTGRMERGRSGKERERGGGKGNPEKSKQNVDVVACIVK